MAITAEVLADSDFGLPDFYFSLLHAAQRYMDFTRRESPSENAYLFHSLAQERAEDAYAVADVIQSTGVNNTEPMLNAYIANQVLGLGNSEPWSPASAAYRVLRAENTLGRMAIRLVSFSNQRAIDSTLIRIHQRVEWRREAVRESRKRAWSVEPEYGTVQGAAQRIGPDHDMDENAVAASSILEPYAYVVAGSVPELPKVSHGPKVNGRDVLIWYGTNRAFVKPGCFIAGRSDVISFGRCRVFVPKDRVMGSLGRGFFGRFFRGDNRVSLIETQPLDEQVFWAELSRSITAGNKAERQALVFLHGFRTSFEDVARRTAQLKVDLGHFGPAAFFSWPSFGLGANYFGDEAAIEGSELAIRNFLTEFAQRSKASVIHIIAHSMGNRGLTRAFEAIAMMAASESPIRFGQVFLAAPDVDAGYFRNVAAAYSKLSTRATLYVTSNDKAIGLSRQLHSYPRVGIAPPVSVVTGIDTIDASHINHGLLGHSYGVDARPVLSDINCLLQGDVSPDSRFGLRRATTENSGHWEFVP
ncbi:MAG: alpha/beta hydrolase [Janthinobacterium lividum]